MTKLGYAIVFVSNMDRSVAFYRDVLGLPVKFASQEWTELATEGTILALHPAAVPNPDVSPPAQPPAGRCQLAFLTADLDLFHTQRLAQGVPCLQPPKVEHGTKLAVYADPDGLPFSIGESPKQSVSVPPSSAPPPAPEPEETPTASVPPPPAPPPPSIPKPERPPRSRVAARSSPKKPRSVVKVRSARKTKAIPKKKAKKTTKTKPRSQAKRKAPARRRTRR
jgi:lactoylglutathione lyase